MPFISAQDGVFFKSEIIHANRTPFEPVEKTIVLNKGSLKNLNIIANHRLIANHAILLFPGATPY